MLSDVTDVWQCDHDVTLILTLDLNKEREKKKKEKRKKKKEKRKKKKEKRKKRIK